MKDNEIMDKLIEFLKENNISTLDLKAMLDKYDFSTTRKYTEIKQPSYTFKEAIAWIKENVNTERYNSANILKEVSKKGIITLTCCFMDKEGKVLVGPDDPFLRVETNEICQDFKDNFGDKNVIKIQ